MWHCLHKHCWHAVRETEIIIHYVLHCLHGYCWHYAPAWPQREYHCIFNPLWPSDPIWHHSAWSTLVQVMAWCLTAPSHYLNQCWLIINEVLWQSPETNFQEMLKWSILDIEVWKLLIQDTAESHTANELTNKQILSSITWVEWNTTMQRSTLNDSE